MKRAGWLAQCLLSRGFQVLKLPDTLLSWSFNKHERSILFLTLTQFPMTSTPFFTVKPEQSFQSTDPAVPHPTWNCLQELSPTPKSHTAWFQHSPFLRWPLPPSLVSPLVPHPFSCTFAPWILSFRGWLHGCFQLQPRGDGDNSEQDEQC